MFIANLKLIPYIATITRLHYVDESVNGEQLKEDNSFKHLLIYEMYSDATTHNMIQILQQIST